MESKETIKQALRILDSHDWYWMMADLAYYQGLDTKARNEECDYAILVRELPEEQHKLMITLWETESRYHACFRPGYTNPKHEEYDSRRKALRNEINQLLAA